MATSSSRDFIYSRSQIISSALRRIGALAQGETATANQLSEGAEALNVIINSWANDGILLWAQADAAAAITAETASITLSSSPDILEITNVYFRKNGSDTPLTKLTRAEYKSIPDKDLAGDPTSYYVEYGLSSTTIYLYPVYEYSTSEVTGTDSNNYVCLLDHTSSTDDKPTTGTNYEDNWELTTLLSTGGTWAASTEYKSGHLRYTKLQRLQDMDAAANNPDFPVRFYKAAIADLASFLSNEYGMPVNERVYYEKLAEIEKTKAFLGTAETGDLTIAPKFR